MLFAQGWDLRRPPTGDVLTQQEYREFPDLRDALLRASKSGEGPGIPEYVLIDRKLGTPLAVFEAKSKADEIKQAIAEAVGYGEALYEAGFNALAVAVAGTADDTFAVRVLKRRPGGWGFVTYEGEPISWIPSREQIERLHAGETELRPRVPSPEVLKAKAEEINGMLREAGLKDDFRPAAIGAIMLALWKSKGAIRRDPKYVLADINRECERAFWDAKKPDLAKSLHVDEANEKLAIRAIRIAQILERLNITTLTAEHDYLGALYEEFFRYTGGNTIGQYFTPRHITRLMADLCDVGPQDVVLDPACGTGGFLIAAMERIQRISQLPREQVVRIVQEQLVGLEAEPVTAALCVANMILRGDGSTGVRRADCFEDEGFPFGEASTVLMNPPFPHKKTDTPPERFIERSLEGLKQRGVAAVIVPSSFLVKSDKAAWRRWVLKHNTLLAVISLPGELFQPYASSTTAIVVFEHGIAHPHDRPVFFCRVANDGYRLKKGVRVPVPGGQLEELLLNYNRRTGVPGFCSFAPLQEESNWAPGAYIEAQPMNPEEFRAEVAELIRNKAAFAARFAPQLAALLEACQTGEIEVGIHIKKGKEPALPMDGDETIGTYFDIRYGQKALHSKEHLSPGKALVISSSGVDNGAYGFFDFSPLIRPPFVTVPSTGSIGEAAVQEYPCGVTDDCLLLLPKPGTPFEALYVAAATLRHEKWRFDYGRKMTPERIAGFPLRMDPGLLSWVREQWERAQQLTVQALALFGGRVGQLVAHAERLSRDPAIRERLQAAAEHMAADRDYPGAVTGAELLERAGEA